MLQPLSKLHLFNHVQKKQLILTILNSTATKRETKNYFLKYQASSFDASNTGTSFSSGISNGFSIEGKDSGPYNRLASTSLAAGGIKDDEAIQHQQQHPLRISIIKIKDLHLISRETLDGIGVTILKLIKLGVSPVLLIDSHDLFHYKQRQKSCTYKHVERDLDHQYFRLSKAIENSIRNAHGSFIQNEDSVTDWYSPDSNNGADNSIKNDDTNKSARHNNNNDTVYNLTGIINTVPVKSIFEIDSDHGIALTFPQSILNYLHQGLVPIIYPIGFECHSSQNKLLPSDLLTENIALNLYQYYKNRLSEQDDHEVGGGSLLSIEKIIYIEPTGGIPSLERMTSAHVLINLKQEYSDISRELQQGFLKPLEKHTHIRNLFHLNNILKQLPDSAAAIITTPQSAAIDDLPLLDDSVFLSNEKEVEVASNKQMSEKINISDTYSEDYSYSRGASITTSSVSGNFNGSNNNMSTASSSSGRIDVESNQNDIVHNAVINQQGEAVTSFRIKNPIIYNILTDRPLISPSLPVYLRKTPLLSTTVLRKGIDVKFFRAKSAEEGLDLVEMDRQGIISLEKLKELIDDSFKKPLDLQNYLQRVNNNVAGLIFTENYEGGAIITWEEVKAAEEANVLRNVKDQDRKKPKTYIPYLDKFAVKRSVQGTFSVADIVFKVMVNTLFPKELIWRSRQNNPVNKWYHERSNGSMTVEGTQWRCFWVGSITREGTELQKYVDICKRIEPSWVTASNSR